MYQLGDDISFADAAAMIELADTDGNGLVRVEEFVRLMMATSLFAK